MTDDDSLIYYGEAVKALGSGRVGGVVAPFATADTADPQGEFFHAETDFGLDVSTRARVVYHHGWTKAYGKRKLAVADLFVGEAGVEGATQLPDDEAGRAIYGLAEAGTLFWSSGSAPHLVVTTPVKGAKRIDSWPIVEVSLTHKPVDKRARAYALKSLLDEREGPVAAPSLLDSSERLVADARELAGLFDRALKARTSDGRHLSTAKRDALKAIADAFSDLWRASKPGPSAEDIRVARVALLRQALDEIGNHHGDVARVPV
jgi:hypothetical protein